MLEKLPAAAGEALRNTRAAPRKDRVMKILMAVLCSREFGRDRGVSVRIPRTLDKDYGATNALRRLFRGKARDPQALASMSRLAKCALDRNRADGAALATLEAVVVATRVDEGLDLTPIALGRPALPRMRGLAL